MKTKVLINLSSDNQHAMAKELFEIAAELFANGNLDTWISENPAKNDGVAHSYQDDYLVKSIVWIEKS